MTETLELPEGQDFFKLNEVCKLANVQPYMLRFWGTEFEQLETTKTDTGQRLYSRPQMHLILEIRRLLFDEGLTIAGARKQIDVLVESGELDLSALPAEPSPEPTKPRVRPAKRKPAKKAEPPAGKKTEKVDKAPSADVQPLLATLRGVREELAEIIEELRKQ